MKIGMLWYDDDKTRPLAEKIKRAADYYAKKYGKAQNECHVHRAAIESEKVMDGVKVKPSKTVLENHFLLGGS